MIAGNVIAAAAVAIGFGHYLGFFVSIDVRVGAIALLAVLALVIAGGLQRSIWLTVGLVALQIGGLALVIVAGAPHIGEEDLLRGATVGGVMSGAALVFFAFIGFDEVVTLSEETRDAERTIPRALLLSLALSTALYVAVGIAAVSTAGWEALAGSKTPLALVIEEDWGGRATDIIALIALASTVNTTLLVMTAASRLVYSIAREGYFPPAFARLGGPGDAPQLAGVAVFAVAAAFAAVADIGFVASVTDFVVFVTFLIVNAAVVRLRFSRPDAARTMRVPLAVARVPMIAVVAFVLALAMMGALQASAWGLGLLVLAAGALVWFVKAGRAGSADYPEAASSTG